MPTQKRRVIYLSDVEWAAAREGATANEESISAYIGLLVREAARPQMRVALAISDAAPDIPVVVGAPKSSTSPTVTFHPVPKPSRKARS